MKPNLAVIGAIELIGSQAFVAKVLGVSAQAVNQWVKGARPVPRKQAIKLSRLVRGCYSPRDLSPKHFDDDEDADAEVNGLAEHGIAPATALLAAGDDTIYHALRLDEFRGREHLRELFAEQVKQIPRWRDTPGSYVSVLDASDTAAPKLLVICKISDGQYMRMVVGIQ